MVQAAEIAKLEPEKAKTLLVDSERIIRAQVSLRDILLYSDIEADDAIGRNVENEFRGNFGSLVCIWTVRFDLHPQTRSGWQGYSLHRRRLQGYYAG